MSQQAAAASRKKREREESRPFLEAFAAVVDVTNPTALSAFLTPYGTITALPNANTSSTSNNYKNVGATSCVTLPTAAPAPTTAGEEEAVTTTNATAITADATTYLKIDYPSVRSLCDVVKIAPTELKRALLAFCPRAVTFERTLGHTEGTAEATTTTDPAAETINAADIPDDEEEADDNATATAAVAEEAAATTSGTAVIRKAHKYDNLPWSTNVGDLCFVLLGAAAPADVRERRRLDSSAQTLAALTHGPSDATDVPPLIRHFRRLFEGHFTAEGEADAFFKALAEPLPMALRLHRTEPALYKVAQHFLRSRDTKEGVNGLANVVKPVEWLAPNHNQNKNSSNQTAYDGTYVCESFQCAHEAYHAHPNVMAVCKTLHSSGALSFQELVSVIPVLGLGIKGHHRVLDMCAAPGSKTLLAIDIAFAEAKGKPLGVVWANEKDHSKAMQTLPARIKRHHCPNVVTTKCDATQLPMLFRSDLSAADGSKVASVRFDRIICDVPCSGDGTVRKERSLIGTWNERYIESLVPTQIRLLRRGLELLEEGGVLAYSTCSLNPKEDEEVLFEVLKNYSPESMQILNVREALATTYDGAMALDAFPSGSGIRVTPTAPSSESPTFRGHRSQDLPVLADTIASSVLRVLPHTHNTGGFFVALIKKVTHTSPAASLPPNVATKLNNWTGHKRYRALDVAKPMAEDTPSDSANAIWRSICAFYGIPLRPGAAAVDSSVTPLVGTPLASAGPSTVDPSTAADLPYFYQLCPTAFLNPDGAGQMKRIQLLSPLAADWCTRVRPYKGPSIDVVLGGTRAFELYDGTYLSQAECRWRVVSESAAIVAEVATKRKILIDLDVATEEVKAYLKELFVKGFTFLLEEGEAEGSYRPVAMHPSISALFEPFLNEARNNWLVGGLLIGVVGGLGAFESNATTTSTSAAEKKDTDAWWLSATLSGKKLELTVDISNRAFGLTTYYGMLDPFNGGRTLVNDGKGAAAGAAAAEEEV